MSIYNVHHITRYEYAAPVTDSANQIILNPLRNEFQEIKSQKITLSPTANIDYFFDFYGNKVGTFTIVEAHNFLEIKSELVVETFPIPLPVSSASVEQQWQTVREQSKLFPYMDFVQLEGIKKRSEIETVVKDVAKAHLSVMETTETLSKYIFENFTYQKGVTNFETQIDEIWELKAGVCQDFAHLLLGMLRMLGVPARYVSGYISPSNRELRGEGATHAWVEVLIPDYGWLGNDPTNNCWVNDRHIKIAVGRDFKDCTPVKGTYKGTSDHTLTVSVIITNEHTKQKTAPLKKPMYVSERKESSPQQNNSYRKFLEMQQQQ